MDPIKANKLLHDVDDALEGLAACADEFGKLWAMVEELHVRTLYIMEKVQLVHHEPALIVGSEPKVTRVTLAALFAQERETFIQRIADAQSKLDAFKSGAHLVDPTRDGNTRAAAGAPQAASQSPRRGNSQLVGL